MHPYLPGLLLSYKRAWWHHPQIAGGQPVHGWGPDMAVAGCADVGVQVVTDDEENSIAELTNNIVEYLPVLIDKKLNLFSSKVNQS